MKLKKSPQNGLPGTSLSKAFINYYVVTLVCIFLFACGVDALGREEAVPAESTDMLLDDKKFVSSLRYRREVNIQELARLKGVWTEYSSRDLVKLSATEKNMLVLSAEACSKFCEKVEGSFVDVIRMFTKDRSQSVRATSAISLAIVGDEEDVEVLYRMVLTDDRFPAIQAGIGLSMMDKPNAMKRFREALKELEKTSSADGKFKLEVLRKHMEVLER